jgi:UDP-N-acetylmuramate--alanine ligase
VTPLARPTDSTRARALLAAALQRPAAPSDQIPPRVIVVDFERQELHLVERGETMALYPVSTARALGGDEGSNLTPPGWHRIQRRIGAGADDGTVFESREPTGRVWQGELEDADLILTRILTLEGLEPGINRGPGVDSTGRYIYIHGTNHVGRLGDRVSHGCVRMANEDVRDLFERVATGDPVVIVGGEPPIV